MHMKLSNSYKWRTNQNGSFSPGPAYQITNVITSVKISSEKITYNG
jgi:hypothetical protein